MYSNKVIEDVGATEKSVGRICFLVPVNKILKWIETAEKFHLGDCIDFSLIMKPNEGNFFMGSDGEVRSPYKCCWFSSSMGHNHGNLGMLVKELKEDLLLTFSFSGGQSRNDRWLMYATYHLIALNREIILEDYDLLEEAFDGEVVVDRNMIEPGNVSPNPAYVKEFMDHYEGLLESPVDDEPLTMRLMNTALLLLSCKNIVTETVHAPAKLNKARKKKNKKPILSYKLLNVIVPRKRKDHEGSEETGILQRLHLCRGHFKYYSNDKPLFGRITGRFWWQPQVRGSMEMGIIKKEYAILKGL